LLRPPDYFGVALELAFGQLLLFVQGAVVVWQQANLYVVACISQAYRSSSGVNFDQRYICECWDMWFE
jgi:hypothetical protein